MYLTSTRQTKVFNKIANSARCQQSVHVEAARTRGHLIDCVKTPDDMALYGHAKKLPLLIYLRMRGVYSHFTSVLARVCVKAYECALD